MIAFITVLCAVTFAVLSVAVGLWVTIQTGSGTAGIACASLTLLGLALAAAYCLVAQ